MFVRVTTTHVAPESVDEAIRLWHEITAPAARQQKGFKDIQLLMDRKTGEGLTITHWETMADAQATGEASAYMKGIIAQFARMFTAPPAIRYYEVSSKT